MLNTRIKASRPVECPKPAEPIYRPPVISSSLPIKSTSPMKVKLEKEIERSISTDASNKTTSLPTFGFFALEVKPSVVSSADIINSDEGHGDMRTSDEGIFSLDLS